MFSVSFSLGVENCPERVDAADAEAPMPPRVETAVGFWSGMGVETVDAEAAVLTMRRFFWGTRKKRIQDKTLFLFLPESLFVRVRRTY